MSTRTLFRGARLLDPASGLDEVGDLLVVDGMIGACGAMATHGKGLGADGGPHDFAIVDCAGLCLAPGLVDMRVQLREPGAEHQETMATGGLAAAAGGITTMVALPNTDPVIDEVALVESVARRSRAIGLANIRTYAAATRGTQGRDLTEMGLMAEAGAVGFTDGACGRSTPQP